ncbi:MAG: 16S rRNA (cytidine(1402)-2'-O)-methyltransferase [Pseudomonadota bacterium]
MEPALYIVATPIGNLSDITERALEVLAGCSVVAAEDTRRTGQLLRSRDISTPMTPYHEHNAERATAGLLSRLENGEAIALVSDAGTPTISDPGYRLVRAVQDADHRVVPIPGPCAAITALSASGLPSDRFYFEGFLPSRQRGRKTRIEALAAMDATLIFYESPHRIADCLADLEEVLGGDREAALAREVTKTFETIRRGSLADLAAWVRSDDDQSRGELVVLVGDSPKAGATDVNAELGALLIAMAEHMPAKQAAKTLSAYSGVKTKTLYNYLIDRRGS